jgi:hypothetical protein
MPALSETDRIEIITARTLARADTRGELIDALALADSPTLAGIDPVTADIGTLHAAALGQLSAAADYLAGLAERLGAMVNAAEAAGVTITGGEIIAGERSPVLVEVPPPGPATLWAIWRVDENIGMSREICHLPREQAEHTASQLSADRSPRGIHYMAMPLGGCPFDLPNSIRYPQGVRS